MNNEILFTGMRYDPETGLFHVRNRYWDFGLGRWTQEDKAGYVDGMNLYAGYFVMAGAMDPSGLRLVPYSDVYTDSAELVEAAWDGTKKLHNFYELERLAIIDFQIAVSWLPDKKIEEGFNQGKEFVAMDALKDPEITVSVRNLKGNNKENWEVESELILRKRYLSRTDDDGNQLECPVECNWWSGIISIRKSGGSLVLGPTTLTSLLKGEVQAGLGADFSGIVDTRLVRGDLKADGESVTRAESKLAARLPERRVVFGERAGFFRFEYYRCADKWGQFERGTAQFNTSGSHQFLRWNIGEKVSYQVQQDEWPAIIESHPGRDGQIPILKNNNGIIFAD